MTTAAVSLPVIRHKIDSSFIPESNGWIHLLFIVSVWFGSMVLGGAYKMRYLGTGVQEFKVVTKSAFQGFLILCLLALSANVHPSRLNLFMGWFGSVVLIVVGRKLLQMALRRDRKLGLSLRNTLIIGSTDYAATMTAKLSAEAEHGLCVIGQMPLDSVKTPIQSSEWLATIDKRMLNENIQVVIVEDSNGANAELMSKLSWHLNEREVDILVVPTFLNQFGPRLEVEPHSSLALVFLDEPRLPLFEKAIKRSMDITLGLIAGLLLLPLMLVIAVCIFISSPGPVFFIQDRVGLSGSLFRFVKFRTMVVGAENMRQDVLGTPDEEMTDRYKNDPRIYPFGRILRRFSLDELPQLWTVVRGKMSIVGPRPLLVEELTLLGDEDHRRHLTKPGLTGLWQISGRKETTWDERIQLDLRYVHEWSIGLDVGIIIKTIKVVLTGEGSY